MKILKGILYFLLTLFIFFGILVLVCAFRPDVTEAIAGFLYPERNNKSVATETGNVSGMDLAFEIEEGDKSPGTGRQDPEPMGSNADREEDRDGIGAAAGHEELREDIVSEYLPPDETELAVPEKVSGKTGYQRIQDEQEQIDEKTAEQLQNRIDTGYTGDGLEFDEVFYPYYAMLDEKGKHVYRQIYANADELYAGFAPVEAVTAGELRTVFSAVFHDHPELFWLETAYAGKYIRNGQCVEIDLKFNRTARNLENEKAVFSEKAGEILAGAQDLPDHYEKEKYVHDVLIGRVSYDIGAEMNQSAYSALVNGKTVCAGYARAFQYLLQQLGIPCYYCTGYAGESHAWNIVMLDDGYYNVDTTWDDTDGGTYDYFNKTDADYGSDHIRQELSVYLPACNGQAYREPEQEAEDSDLRSIEEVGITPEQVITGIQAYYDDCYNRIVQNGSGRYSFYNVIEGEDLLNEWYLNYQNENYRQAYMEDAMTAIGASSCQMSLEIEELQQGRYLILHEVSVR